MSQEEQISQNFKGIIDTTLREGLQFSQANFTMDEMKRIFDYLSRIDPELISHYNLSLLTVAENYVSKVCNIEMPINLVTNRVNGFAHKAGIHLDALIKFGPEKYESFSPRLIGNNRNLIINSIVSGKTSYSDVKRFNKKYSS
jgi:isopropylmalate/homocitrate/citramalate synthase